MSKRIQNDELDWLIWQHLRDNDTHPTSSRDLLRVATYSMIKARMQAMRNAGRIRWHHPARIKQRHAHVRSHGWEVLGCPGDGGSEDGQWHWREGCEDCTRRTMPDPADGVIKPPPIIAFECELRIDPVEITP